MCRSQVGRAPAGREPIKSVVEIHPSLLNADRLGYLRRAILVSNGLVPAKAAAGGGDKLLLDMFYWVRLVVSDVFDVCAVLICVSQQSLTFLGDEKAGPINSIKQLYAWGGALYFPNQLHGFTTACS